MHLKLFPVLLLLCAVAFGACRSQNPAFSAVENANDDSPVIVEINGYAEHRSAFERFYKSRLSDFATQAAQSQGEQDQLRSRLFDEFVQRQLVVREALKKNIVPTEDEIRKAIEDQHKQTSGEAATSNQPTLEGTERRTEMLNDLLTLKYFTSEVLKDVDVTPQEIENYYNQNRAQYQQQNGFYVREIRVPEEAEARRLHQLATQKPNDFNVLAKENSKAPTAINGGAMRWANRLVLPPPSKIPISMLSATMDRYLVWWMLAIQPRWSGKRSSPNYRLAVLSWLAIMPTSSISAQRMGHKINFLPLIGVPAKFCR